MMWNTFITEAKAKEIAARNKAEKLLDMAKQFLSSSGVEVKRYGDGWKMDGDKIYASGSWKETMDETPSLTGKANEGNIPLTGMWNL